MGIEPPLSSQDIIPDDFSSSTSTNSPRYHEARQQGTSSFREETPILNAGCTDQSCLTSILSSTVSSSDKPPVVLEEKFAAEKVKRARIEDGVRVSNSVPSNESSTKSHIVQPSSEHPDRLLGTPTHALALHPASTSKSVPAENVSNLASNSTTTIPNQSPTSTPNQSPSPTSQSNNINKAPQPTSNNQDPPQPKPSPSGERRINAPPTVVVNTVPAPEAKPVAGTKDKLAPIGSTPQPQPTVNNPAVTSTTSLSPTPTPPPPTVASPTPAPAPSSNPSIKQNPENPKPPKPIAEGNEKLSSGQLTSIAIGVACAASLFLFAILVVIFKIRVSRKKARSRYKADDLFGSSERPSFSDSDLSRNSVFVVPRPIANKFPLNPEPPREKSPFVGPNFTGIGARTPSPHHQMSTGRRFEPIALTTQSYSPTPIRPPRSPLKTQLIQRPEELYHPQAQGTSQNFQFDAQSLRSHSQNGQTRVKDLHELEGHEYNDAMEYLDRHYEDQAYESMTDPSNYSNYDQSQLIGMKFMQVEDRPYDHRYTVDRNGVLNNFSPTEYTDSRDSDFYFKKRAT